ncbi:MAG: superoxide dismutase [Nitrospinae bacterium]|nr:superoxide dismutase [Nitrospinota bacterium]
MLMAGVTKAVRYEPKTFPGLNNLIGITPVEIEEHLKLYNGYVANTNLLREKIGSMVVSGSAGTPEFAELVRRLGFEYNGMRLHELYFENLSGGGKRPSQMVVNALEDAFNGFGSWETLFRKVAAMRGVGWVILYQDPLNENLSVHWINQHEDGHPVGFNPILVLDCWEHAWTAYLRPTERAKYIEDFFTNIDWDVVERRFR